MPAPGAQHNNFGGQPIMNPFEEVKSRISEYTAQEIASLQSRLEKQLGPEYISSRSGPSGQKVHYLAAEKCIQLANEVFGFNGWSSQIINVQVDFVDENPTSLKISLGMSVVVRVTLRDGTFHEDIGYGHIENCKGKAAAFEKAKKEGTTDALKRALRNFGNVLGNCIYDKEYLSKVTKLKVAPTKWDVDGLHRHSAYAPATTLKMAIDAPAQQDTKQCVATELISPDILEDEFGDFDEADFAVSHDPDSHPDEVVLPTAITAYHLGSELSNTSSVSSGVTNLHVGGGPNQSGSGPNKTPAMVAPARLPPLVQQSENNVARTGLQTQNLQVQLHTPNAGFIKSSSSGGPAVVSPQQNNDSETSAQQNAVSGIGRILNQPSRNAALPVPISPIKQQRLPSSNEESAISGGFGAPPEQGPTGFFSARAAALIVESGTDNKIPAVPPRNLPAFNPLAESPSIRKTPGVDHSKTRPTTIHLKHISGTVEPEDSESPIMRANIINPQLSATRRIGAPGSPSPLGNKGAYKPPTMKRSSDGATGIRPPLGNIPVPANGMHNVGTEAKRQRINGPH